MAKDDEDIVDADILEENQPSRLSSTDKINAVLGITGGKSVDEFLDGLSLDTEAIHETLGAIDDQVQTSLQNIDQAASNIQSQSEQGSSILEIKNIDLSLREVEDMISLSKKMFKHIAESILTTDLVDSELVQAASKLLESIHINIAEFIQLYRSKQQFVDKIKVMIFQQEQKKELMLLKHKLDLEKIQAKGDKDDPNVVEAEGMVSYSQESIVKAMNKYDTSEADLDD